VTVVLGALADELGAASCWEPVERRHQGRNFDVERRFFKVPSLEYRSVQPITIGVDVDHGRPIGQVKYLERTNAKLYAVCEIDSGSLSHGPWAFSPLVRHRDGHDIELLSLAVTKSPASVGIGTLDAWPGTLREAAREVVYQDGFAGELIRRAAEYDRRRKRGEPLVIQGVHPKPPTPKPTVAPPRRLLEYRHASTVEVHRTRRELDLLIVPAERPTRIHERSRSYTEVFSHGAFSGCDASRVRVNLYHQRERVIGKALQLDPWDELGLTGTVKLARTRDADEALALIDDDILGVSAGFAPLEGGEQWRGDHRRVRRALLHHIALVDEAAYDGARVLNVRDRELVVR